MADSIHHSAVDGIGYTSGTPADPGIVANQQLRWFGNPNNLSGNQTANQQIGAVALPAIAAGTTGTVTVANGLVGLTSYIFLTAVNNPGVAAPTAPGDTTAGRGMDVWLENNNNGAGFVIGYRPAAAMAAAWNCFYLIINS